MVNNQIRNERQTSNMSVRDILTLLDSGSAYAFIEALRKKDRKQFVEACNSPTYIKRKRNKRNKSVHSREPDTPFRSLDRIQYLQNANFSDNFLRNPTLP